MVVLSKLSIAAQNGTTFRLQADSWWCSLISSSTCRASSSSNFALRYDLATPCLQEAVLAALLLAKAPAVAAEAPAAFKAVPAS
jgi:hypothetical protein